VALVLGAVDVLAKGWHDHGAGGAEDSASLPVCWAIKLDESDWPGCSAAIFHSQEVWLEVVPDENHNMAELASDGQIGVVTDRSVGTGIDRRLHWEIVALDPKTDDIIAEINRKEGVELDKLSIELTSVVKQRCSTRMEALGLTPEANEVPPSPRATSVADTKVATPGKVADAILRINKATPPGTKPPTLLTPDRWVPPSYAGCGDESQAPPVEAPAFEEPSAEEPPAAPEVQREAPPSPSTAELPAAPQVAPAPTKPPDEGDEVQADSILPCMFSRSPGKPNVLCSVVPECFKGIF